MKAFRTIKRQLRKGGNARRKTLGVDQYLMLIDAAPPHLRAFLTVAYNTGMRSGELRELKWSCIDRDKKVIRLSAKATKEDRPKVIPMNRHDFVFTYLGKPIKGHNGMRTALRTACQKAGITYGEKLSAGIIFHDIRRTVKTNMLNAGVDEVYRNLIVGHSLRGMDAHYMAPSDEDLHRAMARYTAWLDDQIARRNVDRAVDQR